MPARCRACHGLLRWTKTRRGKLMPLDLDPNPQGNVWLIAGAFYPNGAQKLAHIGKDATPPLGLPPEAIGPFMPHHATCPNADEFRS